MHKLKVLGPFIDLFDCGDDTLLDNDAWIIAVLSCSFMSVSFIVKLILNTSFSLLFTLKGNEYLAFSKPPEIEVNLDWIN